MANFKKNTFLRLLKYFTRHKLKAAIAFILMLSSNAFSLIGPYLIGKTIDAIDLKSGVDFALVTKYTILMAILFVISSMLAYLLTVVMVNLTQGIVREMRQEVFDKILSLKVGELDKIQAGNLINRISYDIDTVNASLSNDILVALTGIVSIIGALIGMLLTTPLLLGVFVITVPLSLFIASTRSKVVRPLYRKRSAKLADLNGYSEEMLSGIKTIKAYGREEQMEKVFAQKNMDAVEAYYQADYYGSLIGPAVNFVNNLATVLISSAGAFLFVFNMISIGDISSFLLYAKKFSGPINEYANILGEIQSALAAAERVFNLLDKESEPLDLENSKVANDVKGNVSFNNVKFGYDEDKTIIHNLSFEAKQGQVIAIVGPTGAGKTTLINLLMRFYYPNNGNITLDKIDINDYTLKSLRESFNMVLQDTWLFDGTIFENISYGKENATLEEVKKACKDAFVDQFIESLPEQYNTMISDGGVNLSKGQKQLLTIARAMLSNAKILILDEATSNVDTRTEILIREAMDKLMKGRTCFVIAHRLTTIKNADLILVVNNGDIVERGKHQELLDNNGFYSQIYNAQFE